jgi:lipopolysaccharide export system protein LptA
MSEKTPVTLRWQAGGVRKTGLRAAALLALAMPLAPALAQISGLSGVNGANSQKPIDIESDRLEVDDKKHIATFIGNVSATQGDYNLRSPRLEVTYDKTADAAGQNQGKTQEPKAAKPSQPASAGVAADPVSSGQIKFIHATGGKVVVTSKKDEQEVTGDDAVYDVKAQKIVMTGKEVILSQKKNVVKGKQLDIDLATGRAVVIPDKGRVQAVFSQESAKGVISANQFLGAKKKDDEPAPEAPKRPEPQPGWQQQSH